MGIAHCTPVGRVHSFTRPCIAPRRDRDHSLPVQYRLIAGPRRPSIALRFGVPPGTDGVLIEPKGQPTPGDQRLIVSWLVAHSVPEGVFIQRHSSCWHPGRSETSRHAEAIYATTRKAPGKTEDQRPFSAGNMRKSPCFSVGGLIGSGHWLQGDLKKVHPRLI